MSHLANRDRLRRVSLSTVTRLLSLEELLITLSQPFQGKSVLLCRPNSDVPIRQLSVWINERRLVKIALSSRAHCYAIIFEYQVAEVLKQYGYELVHEA